MEAFFGKWNLVESEDFDVYLKEVLLAVS